jgi:ABC-type transporter Mla subunit MlaD
MDTSQHIGILQGEKDRVDSISLALGVAIDQLKGILQVQAVELEDTYKKQIDEKTTEVQTLTAQVADLSDTSVETITPAQDVLAN